MHFYKTSWPQDYETVGHDTSKTANKINSGNQLITIFFFFVTHVQLSQTMMWLCQPDSEWIIPP